MPFRPASILAQRGLRGFSETKFFVPLAPADQNAINGAVQVPCARNGVSELGDLPGEDGLRSLALAAALGWLAWRYLGR